MLLRTLIQESGTSSIPSDRWKKIARSPSDRPWIVTEGWAQRRRRGPSSPPEAAPDPAVASSTHDPTTADDHVKDFMVRRSSMAFTD